MTTIFRAIKESHVQKQLTSALIILTLMWVVLLVASEALAGPAVSAMDYAQRFHNWPVLYAIIYVNAGMLTLVTATLMAAWSLSHDNVCNTACVVALVASVLYGVLNSFVYFSQVFVVPNLVKQVYASAQPNLFVAQLEAWLQLYAGSTIANLNQVAYCLLAIPSMVVGRWMWSDGGRLRTAGWCLVISGVLSVISAVGMFAGVSVLGILSLVSGVVFLVGLILRRSAY